VVGASPRFVLGFANNCHCTDLFRKGRYLDRNRADNWPGITNGGKSCNEMVAYDFLTTKSAVGS
jgi:hypothetical protein